MKKLILILLFFTGLTHAQEFDFNCTETFEKGDVIYVSVDYFPADVYGPQHATNPAGHPVRPNFNDQAVFQPLGAGQVMVYKLVFKDAIFEYKWGMPEYYYQDAVDPAATNVFNTVVTAPAHPDTSQYLTFYTFNIMLTEEFMEFRNGAVIEQVRYTRLPDDWADNYLDL